MLEYNQLSDIDNSIEEGQLLIAAIAILTSIDHRHLVLKEWGSNLHPDIAVQKVAELANKLYYEKEWKAEQDIKNRDSKINNIIE